METTGAQLADALAVVQGLNDDNTDLVLELVDDLDPRQLRDLVLDLGTLVLLAREVGQGIPLRRWAENIRALDPRKS